MDLNGDLDIQSDGTSLTGSRNQRTQQRNNRIYIDRSHHDVYKTLTDAEGVESPFDSMKNVFMLAVFIGYQQGEQIPLNSKVDIFSWDILSRDEENVSLLRAVALASTEDVKVLADQGEVLDIAERYANAGIVEIKKHIADKQDNRIMHLVNLLGASISDDLITSLVDEIN